MDMTTIIGNLTSDPEIKMIPNGNKVCTFGVAVNSRRGGDAPAKFYRVSAWNKLGELCAEYLAKGRKVCVVGEVSTHAYNNSQGEAMASLDLMANSVEFLSSRQSDAAEPANARYEAARQQPMEQVQVNDLPF